MATTYSINLTDSETTPAWMTLCTVATPGAQDSGRVRYTVTTEQPEALEAALDADESVVEYDAQEDEEGEPSTVRCECGAWSGERCSWTGPESETVLVEYMPEQHRSSHTAAGNRGMWPANGASRIRVERSCAAGMVKHDGDWCEIVE